MTTDDTVKLHGVGVLRRTPDGPALDGESAALRDFVYETNQGGHIWFLADFDELGEKPRAAG
ncbi:DUF4180 domain-containing protein [Streptomyces sp. NPDC002838]|uniref:DUF4180 domain-containing protein n=1 Tax=Streptomyces sp. NPDC002838 TaxID=3154436 RepID=UPI00332BAB69